MSKPGIPKGTRDFNAAELAGRNFIFNTIRTCFKKYGYQPIETPTMENLSTLTGKYGEEGDQLIFKILNSGDYLAKVDEQKLIQKNSKALSSEISEKALRYDLTVPFARFVVMHQNDLAFPFKRYQIQPVWRADRPQKGRYREFYQCDADVVGSDSLLHEAEFICIYDEVLSKLGLKDFEIAINNRKILAGIAEYIGNPDALIDMTVAIDKFDKVGLEGVQQELRTKGFTEEQLLRLNPIFELKGNNTEKLKSLEKMLNSSPIGLRGIEEMRSIINFLQHFNLNRAQVNIDLSLARGLNYYTGAIFEVKSKEVTMGSIGGGGRYDDLTGMFGLKGMSGVGISFGADRIYDVMLELNLFPEAIQEGTKVLICHFDDNSFQFGLPLLSKLREAGIASEIYPSVQKMQKQLKYANDKSIPYAIVIGDNEIEKKSYNLKNMQSGEQSSHNLESLISILQ